MSEQQRIVLVTSATGTLASSLLRALSAYASANKIHVTVHATTRDPSSNTAAALRSANTNEFLAIKLFKVDFSDISTLAEPVKDVTLAYLNFNPEVADLTVEGQHAQNVLSALRSHASRTLQRLVYSSGSATRDTSDPTSYRDIDKFPWMKAVFTTKHNIERAVIDYATNVNIPWTILKPGTFMTNLLPPISTFMYPRLSDKQNHRFTTALVPGFKYDWLDPESYGEYAVHALLLPSDSKRYDELYENRRIPVAALHLSLAEVAESLNTFIASGKVEGVSKGTKVDVEYIDHETAEAQKEGNILIASQLFQNLNPSVFGGVAIVEDRGEKYGVTIGRGGLEEFWERENGKGRIAAALGY